MVSEVLSSQKFYSRGIWFVSHCCSSLEWIIKQVQKTDGWMLSQVFSHFSANPKGQTYTYQTELGWCRSFRCCGCCETDIWSEVNLKLNKRLELTITAKMAKIRPCLPWWLVISVFFSLFVNKPIYFSNHNLHSLCYVNGNPTQDITDCIYIVICTNFPFNFTSFM